MRFIPLILTIALVAALHIRWAGKPAFGMLSSPQHGFWQHAEPVGPHGDEQLSFPALKGRSEVWLDERMVPHIFAEQESDAYFIQGYLHARDRLWQMELQTMAAAGRLCEILGPGMLDYDRRQRRIGMVYAAEQTVKAIEQDPTSKTQAEAYANGVNAYISSLRPRDYPIEYKLLGYSPEPWDLLKTALLLKYMSYDLAYNNNDLEYTNARALFSKKDFDQMYPDFTDMLDPIIPKGTVYPSPGAQATAPSDSLVKANESFYHFQPDHPDPDNGSNNWAVAGRKTRSGAPILCNDPHLGLSLPSLWYEMQIHTPAMNVYGVSLPGAPGIIIGFNDRMGWAVTNGSEDVLDYYRMDFRNGKQEYLYNGSYRKADLRLEKIKVRGGKTFVDTVAYTVWGPVMYDDTYKGPGFLSVRWKAHDASNELLTFNRLNHAKNYKDYLDAIEIYTCPAQNFIYAGKDGNIGIWHNGQYPLRWKDQGKFVMPGSDSTFAWQGYIPWAENPHIYNPAEGFVSSANQHPTDSTYPYHMIGEYDLFRGKRINEQLRGMDGITPEDMMKLQNDNMNLFAATAIPLIMDHLDPVQLDSGMQRKCMEWLFAWNGEANPDSEAATVFNLLWEELEHQIWNDDLQRDSIALKMPQSKTTLLWLLRDTAMHFVDDIRTPEKETLSQLVQRSFDSAAMRAATMEDVALGKSRGTDIRHLTRSIAAFSRMGLNTGGGQHIVNATKKTHGPSWRMVVELGTETKAYGIYPGGQSGNPGSAFYDNMVDDWVAGKYYSLNIYDRAQQPAHLRGKIFFGPGE